MKNRKDVSFLTKTKKARGESQSRGAALGASHSDLALDGVETCATPQSKPPQEADKQGFGGAADGCRSRDMRSIHAKERVRQCSP